LYYAPKKRAKHQAQYWIKVKKKNEINSGEINIQKWEKWKVIPEQGWAYSKLRLYPG